MPEALTISGTVEASYHQFLLLDGETYPEDVDSLPSQDHGLVTTASGILLIKTGIHTGPVRLVVEHWQSSPRPAKHDWEDVVETSLHVPHGNLRVAGLMREPSLELRAPIRIPSTLCHVRVHASGRDRAFDLAVPEAVEDYLLQLWEADIEEPAGTRASDE